MQLRLAGLSEARLVLKINPVTENIDSTGTLDADWVKFK
jgi:hypothetical protein